MTSRRANGSILLPLALFALARAVVFFGFGGYVSDLHLYHEAATRGVLGGGRAYVDFHFPYPPLSLPLVYAPIALGRPFAAYRTAFRLEMVLVDLLCLALLLRLVRRLGGGGPAARLATIVYALGGLAVGHERSSRLPWRR